MNAKNDLQNLASKVAALGKQINASTIPAVVAKAAATPQAPTKGTLQKVADNALEVAKAIGPDILGMIPGVGPAAKLLLSTLNDDEWFSEFKGAGATFNEYVQASESESSALPSSASGVISVLPSVFIGSCSFYPVVLSGEETSFSNNFMPSVLAYIRGKTNNVLADDTIQYTNAFAVASNLYAAYYTGMKYIKLSENLPTNIPLLSQTLQPLRPQHLSAFRGIFEALRDYLKVTIKLPYAWTEYLRWRFGTVFKSDNTGRPGLVMYDLTEGISFDDDPDTIELSINTMRKALAACGRAAADFKLAYDDHQIRYDVEDSHYDEKEFNLRCNLANLATDSVKTIYMDSRLAPSEAIQSVTMSVASEFCPVRCTSGTIHTYVPEGVAFYSGTDTQYRNTAYPGWYRSRYNPTVQMIEDTTMSFTGGTPDNPSYVKVKNVGEYMNSLPFATIRAGLPEEARNLPIANGRFGASMRMGAALYMLAGDALQLHGLSRFYNFGGVWFATAKLAYDTAKMSTTQVEAVQRTAMRNLTRGNYKSKTPATAKQEVKVAVSDLEKVVIEDINKKMA